jgi:conjugal transfer ATP-binding protein TraC
MNFLIPKSIKSVKLQIWRNFGLWDLFIISFNLTIVFLILNNFNLSFFTRIIIIFLSFLLSFPLTIAWLPRKKGWEVLGLIFIFYLQRKKSKKNANLLNFKPFKKIINYYTLLFRGKQKTYFSGLEISGFDIFLLKENEVNLKINELSNIFRLISIDFSLIKIKRPIDLKSSDFFYKSKIDEIKNNKDLNKKNKSRLDQLNGMLNVNQDIVSNKFIKQSSFYLFFYSSDLTKLKNDCDEFEKKIFSLGLKVKKVNYFNLINIYRHLIHNNDKEWENFLIKNEKLNFHQENINLDKFTKIKPLKQTRKFLIIDKIYQSTYNIYDFPFQVKVAWLLSLSQLENTEFTWNFFPCSIDLAKKQLNKAIQNLATMAFIYKSEADKRDNYYHLDSLNKLLDEVSSNNEKIFNSNLFINVYGESKKELDLNCSMLEYEIKRNNMKFDRLYFRQLQSWISTLPVNLDLLKEDCKEMPASTIGASFPFLNQKLFDKEGLFLGFNSYGSHIFFDQKIRNQERKNSNQIIIGTSGSGKSHLSKKEINFQATLNTKIVVIDPEREYKNLCKYHNGQWIDVGNGTSGNINPLQIVIGLEDEQENQNQKNNQIQKNQNSISTHMQFLEEFISISAGGLIKNEINLIMIYVNKLYEKFKIHELTNIQDLKNEEFPRFQDLYELIEFDFKNLKDKKIKFELRNLLIILSKFVKGGSDSNLWNKHTNIKSDKKNHFQVFDIYTLNQSGNKRIINAQMFLILKFIENEVRKNKNQNLNLEKFNWISITIDEAHLLIDKEFPNALIFMYQMVKRIRKYNGMINIITQNVNDFIGDETIKKYATAIINSSQYLKVLNLQPNDLEALDNLYLSSGGLSFNEKDFIARAGVGKCFFIISSFYRMCFNVNISIYEQKAIV